MLTIRQARGARFGQSVRVRAPRVTLYADNVDWPLWAPSGGPLNEDALPLSETTKLRIKAWFNAYDEPPRRDWPVWKPPEGSSPEAVEQAWVDEGEEIRRIVEVEVGHPVGYET